MTPTILHSSPSHIQPQAPLSSDYDYISFRAHASFSPCQINTLSATPPRKSPNSSNYASPAPMLSPSPLRRRINFNDSAMDLDIPESFIGKVSTPFRSSSTKYSQLESMESPILFRGPDMSCDEEIAFFQSPYNAGSAPVQTPDRYVLQDLSSNIAHSDMSSQAHKRKVNLLSTTPHLTPLRIHHPLDEKGSPQTFARLAPLQAPQFLHSHSPTNTKMLKPESMLQMRIADKTFDHNVSSDEDEGLQKNEVSMSIVESRSPGGHVTKRRARPRPGLRGLMMPPSPCPLPNLSSISDSSFYKKTHNRRASSRSNRDFDSIYRPIEKPNNDFDRVASSATLFFGPAIVNTESSTNGSKVERPLVKIASPGNNLPPNTPSPNSLFSDDSFDILHHDLPNSSYTSAFLGPADSSFAISVANDSPLSSRKSSPRGQVPKKYKKPRDSGVALTDEESESNMSILSKSQTFQANDVKIELHTERTRKAFDGTSSMYFDYVSSFDSSFVTPELEPRKEAAWPKSVKASKNALDEFIVKTLISGGNDVGTGKRMPNTPQKRVKPNYLGAAQGQRPWASATTSKVANVPTFGEKLKGLDFGKTEAVQIDQGRKARNRPRKTCPEGLRFPSTIGYSKGDNYEQRRQDLKIDQNSSFASMHGIGARARTYGNVGLGRPLDGKNVAGLKAQAIMRRSSSGAFSSSSEGSLGTPTKVVQEPSSCDSMHPSPIIDSPTWLQHSTLKENRSATKKNTSVGRNTSLSAQSAAGQYSTVTEGIIGTHRRSKEKSLRNMKSTFWNNHLMPSNETREETGRFETEFIEVDEIGAGEFGRAMKVRYKKGYGQEDALFAIKISKRFEGIRHRIRLREEVDILRHLSAASGAARHPNVLCYIDSWEQNEQLYILTEICEYGNFAHFLSEYGHHFARLDEARVWKIFAELSNGLRFIHDAGVIHLDFKPANIFITASGGFKIGDFGMASLWPRLMGLNEGSNAESSTTFEREGDKMYLAAEVLRGVYGKETDIFSFGMTMLETAANIVVPTQGELWHRLRDEDFTPVEGFEEECSEELVSLIKSMMRKDPGRRPDAKAVFTHPVIRRTRIKMEKMIERIQEEGDTRVEMMFKGSALAGVEETFLEEILKKDSQVGIAMEVCADFIEEKRNSQ